MKPVIIIAIVGIVVVTIAGILMIPIPIERTVSDSEKFTLSFPTKFNAEEPKVRVNIERSLFRNYISVEESTKAVDGSLGVTIFEILPRDDITEIYQKIVNESENIVFVYPIFTAAAYSEPGFYSYYREECDLGCLDVSIQKEYRLSFQTSGTAIQVLSILGYQFISDIDIDDNPEILKKYDAIILLHNEYVTKKEFDAITNHPKVIYLYPNALYAEIEYDPQKNSIKLIKGHGYPNSEIQNGFDWEFDNTHPDEFDKLCENWQFSKVENGYMLNCFPEDLINTNENFLKQLKELISG